MVNQKRHIKWIRTGGAAGLLLILIGWYVYTQWITPFPIHVQADPELPFFFNSLAVFQGSPYTFVDHPGTPVEITGTLLLALTYPFLIGQPSFIGYHLHHPDLFLTLARGGLTLASMGAVIYLIRRAPRWNHWTDDLAAVTAGALFFALHPAGFQAGTIWSHNSFNFPGGASLLVGLLLVLRSPDPLRTRNMVWLGLAGGLLTAVQLTFGAWGVGAAGTAAVYAWLERTGGHKLRKAFLTYAGSFLGAFLISTLPVINRYPEFFSFILRILTHQGRHGRGPAGFLSWGRAQANLHALWGELPGLFLGLALGGVLILLALYRHRGRLRQHSGLWAFCLGTAGQIILMLALIVKHPGASYAQGPAACLAVLLPVVLKLLNSPEGENQKGPRLLTFGLSLLFLTAFSYNLYRSVVIREFRSQHIRQAQAEITQDLREMDFPPGRTMTRLWTYGLPSNCYALWYGNSYAGGALADSIAGLCPHDLELNIWSERVQLPSGSQVPLEEVDWNVIIATETTLRDNQDLAEFRTVRSSTRLGNFGSVLYLLPRP